MTSVQRAQSLTIWHKGLYLAVTADDTARKPPQATRLAAGDAILKLGVQLKTFPAAAMHQRMPLVTN